MKDKSLLLSFVYLIMTALLLATSVLAWFAIADEVYTGDIFAGVSGGAVRQFRVRKNGINYDELYPTSAEVQANFPGLIVDRDEASYGYGYAIINNAQQMHNFFGDTVPGDQFEFLIDIINFSAYELQARVNILQIESYISGITGYDMRDVYYIVDGTYKVTKDVGGEKNVITKPFTTNINEADDETTFNHYRITNLIDENKTLHIINTDDSDVNLVAPSERLTIEFTIAYDVNATHNAYQNGMFRFNAIYIYLV